MPSLIQNVLEAASQSGGEVIVQLKQANGELYRGRVQNLQPNGFTLFHSGQKGGVLWAFLITDVATVGMVVDVPSDASKALPPIEYGLNI